MGHTKQNENGNIQSKQQIEAENVKNGEEIQNKKDTQGQGKGLLGAINFNSLKNRLLKIYEKIFSKIDKNNKIEKENEVENKNNTSSNENKENHQKG